MLISPVQKLGRCAIFFAASVLSLLAQNTVAWAEDADVLLTSPKKDYQIEQTVSEAGDEEIWIVNPRDRKQREMLPQPSGNRLYDFSFSPDEQWLAINVHYGSRMAGFRLFRHKKGVKFEQVLDEKPAWNWLDHNKLDGMSAADMMRHLAWSSDSARLLLRTPVGGEAIEKGRPTGDYFYYYNTRSRRFEMTDFLRGINRNALRILQSDQPERQITEAQAAEPMDPLPPLGDLRSRFESADAKLNKVYGSLIKKLEEKPENQTLLRNQQREWIKLRDAGADAFAAAREKPERPAFRQYYLASATEARVSKLEEWLERESH